VLRPEVLRQNGNVAAAISRRGQLELDDAQAIVKVLPKRALLDHRSELAVGRGDDAHVHLLDLVATEPLQLSELDGAQELGLYIERACDGISSLRELCLAFQPSRMNPSAWQCLVQSPCWCSIGACGTTTVG